MVVIQILHEFMEQFRSLGVLDEFLRVMKVFQKIDHCLRLLLHGLRIIELAPTADGAQPKQEERYGGEADEGIFTHLRSISSVGSRFVFP